MRVLIDMKMPEICDLCPCSYRYLVKPAVRTVGCNVLHKIVATDYDLSIPRPSWCPLEEIPPHGDLIDRDKFRSTVFIGEQCLYSWDELEDAIDYAPTVIEAEEGERW